MEIRELWLKDYGKFHDHKLSLKDGMNIIYGGNESGKSTIHSFIRAMFFGLNRSRGKAAKTDEYQLRRPWDDTTRFAGAMRLENDGEMYLIERTFEKSAQNLRVYREAENFEEPIPEQALQECLGGLSEAAFVNSVFIPQAHCETEEALSEELRNFLLNAEHSLDSHVDVSAALQILRKKKKVLEQQKKEAEQQFQSQVTQKQQRLNGVKSELELLRQQMGYPMQPKKKPAAPKKRNGSAGRMILELALFVAGIAAIAGALYSDIWQLKTFLMIFGVVFLLMMLTVMFLFGPSDKEDEEIEEEAPEPSQGDLYLQQRMRSLQAEQEELQKSIDLEYQKAHADSDIEKEIAALQLAMERICEVADRIYSVSGQQVSQLASDILCDLTNGKYHRLFLDESSEVRVSTGNHELGLHQVSGGTLQQIYFSLRMAAGEVLAQGKELPVILDEAFVFYDERRLESAMRWLLRNKKQVILFTSQKREHQMLQKIKQDM